MEKHTHKFERRFLTSVRYEDYIEDGKKKTRIVRSKGAEIWKCVFPSCKTYLNRSLAEGRLSICWKCGEAIILDKENMALKHPTHSLCRKIREKAEEQVA